MPSETNLYSAPLRLCEKKMGINRAAGAGEVHEAERRKYAAETAITNEKLKGKVVKGAYADCHVVSRD